MPRGERHKKISKYSSYRAVLFYIYAIVVAFLLISYYNSTITNRRGKYGKEKL